MTEISRLYRPHHLSKVFFAKERPWETKARLHINTMIGELRWASWGEDRLVGLEAPVDGLVTLVQRRCQGKEMRLNFRTEQDGWIKVELVHPPVTPPREVKAFDGFSVEDAEILSGDERSRIVRWQGENDLSPLKDREVSIRLHMHRARVFSTFL